MHTSIEQVCFNLDASMQTLITSTCTNGSWISDELLQIGLLERWTIKEDILHLLVSGQISGSPLWSWTYPLFSSQCYCFLYFHSHRSHCKCECQHHAASKSSPWWSVRRSSWQSSFDMWRTSDTWLDQWFLQLHTSAWQDQRQRDSSEGSKWGRCQESCSLSLSSLQSLEA